MSARQLRQFAAVVEHRGVVPAAARLRMSRSSLASAMQRLERAVGTPLLVRGREFALTDAGRLVHQHALRVVDDLLDVEEAIARARDLDEQTVVVSATAEDASWLSSAAVTRFIAGSAKRRLRILPSATADLAVAAVRAGDSDLALAPATALPAGGTSNAVGLQAFRLLAPDLGERVAADGLWSQPGVLPLALGEDLPLNRSVIDRLERQGVRPLVLLEGAPLALRLAVAASGETATVISEDLLRGGPPRGTRVVEEIPLPSRAMHLLQSPVSTPAVEILVELVRVARQR